MKLRIRDWALRSSYLVVLVLLILGASASTTLAEGDPSRGEQLFRSQCSMCHTTELDGPNKIGPNLHGLFGSIAATKPNYQFSSAARSRPEAVLWDDASINAHTDNPQKFTPGTKMTYAGLHDRSKRADLIAYLRIATAVPPTDPTPEDGGLTFHRNVRPILERYCDSCHGRETKLPPKRVNGFLSSTYDEVMSSGQGGDLVVPGHAERSAILTFLDGSRHFTSPTSREISVIERWINHGARVEPRSHTDKILFTYDIPSNDLAAISCLLPQDTFARISLFDQDTTQVYFSDWSKADAAPRWTTWPVKAEPSWPKLLGVRLSLSTEAETIFIIHRQRTDEPLQNHEEGDTIDPNPINLNKIERAVFQIWVGQVSDVILKIFSTKSRESVWSKNEKNLPTGLNKIKWDLKAEGSKLLNEGQYVARFSVNDAHTNQPSIDIIISFSVFGQ